MLILCGAVTLWVGGFDVFVRVPGRGLRSPRRFVFGAEALRNRNCAPDRRAMHIGVVASSHGLLQVFPCRGAWLGIAVVAALLAYEHSLVKPTI